MERNQEKIEEKKSWLDTSFDQWISGENMPDVEARCAKLCAKYLGGTWAEVTDPIRDLEVRRIPGGLSNQLYYVGLKDHLSVNIMKEPHEVAIKFYQPKFELTPENGKYERLNDTIIVLLVSQHGIGPRVYGLFDNGMIQRYYKHEQFQAQHQQKDYLLRQALHQLAKLHLLQVPIVKERDPSVYRLHNFVHLFIEGAYGEMNLAEKIDEFKLTTLAKHPIREEFEWLQRMLSQTPKTYVFCHHDFRSSNIMVSADDKVMLCDFEYSGYGVRGLDLANLILEWGHGTWSKDKFARWNLPNQEVFDKIARFYLEGCNLVQSEDWSEESLEKLISEIKVCVLEKAFIVTAFHLNLRKSMISSIEFDQRDNLEIAETAYALYHRTKRLLIEEGLIKENY